MDRKEYKSTFAKLLLKPLISEEKDKYLAMASLKEVSRFIPNIDTKKNIDLLPVAFNACVINRVNKNNDVIDTATALAMYQSFIYKPINIEHDRKKVIGMVLTAGFSEFGTDRPLSLEEVGTMTAPFNLTLGGVLWKIIAPKVTSLVEDASDPSSDKYLSVSASWELGFTGYRIVLLDGGCKNLLDAKRIISDEKEINEVEACLTALGGNGKLNDLFAYRMPCQDVIPLGIGLTEKPAAEVKGIATESPIEIGQENNIAIDKTEKTNEIIAKNENNISQTHLPDVKTERNVMKITDIKDITDETLKTCSASVISEFISTKLKEGNEVWAQEKNALNDQLAKAHKLAEDSANEAKQLKDQVTQMQAAVDALNSANQEREKVEKFNSRMAIVAEAYELDDELKAVIVEEIKSLASDEDFNKWNTKAKTLLKGYAKKALPLKKDDSKDGQDCKDGKGKCKADDDLDDAEAKKKSAKAAIDDALENGKKAGGLPNSSSAASPSMKEKYATAFAKENIVITQ